VLHKIVLEPDTNFQIQFRRKNIDETWGPVFNIKTIKNSKPPATPSTPTVVAYLGQLVVTWNGQSADGSAYLPDFAQCEIHVSEVSGFTPTDATKAQYFSSAGGNQQMTLSGLLYDHTYYVKLVATNTSGAKSIPSAQAYATVKRISGIELQDGSINVSGLNLTRRGLRQNLQYNQPTPPSSTANPGNPPFWNDTWFDSDDSYKFYRYNHATPFRAQGANESWEAYFDANAAATDLDWREIPLGTAYQAAGSKVFFQDNDPGALASDGDMWYSNSASGAIARTRKNGAWVTLAWGFNPADGSIAATKLVANSITANQMAANSITTTQLAAGAVIASTIQSGAITADKIGTNQIITSSANIGTGVIDDAKIANVSAGKLSAGTISANIILSGAIRTANTGARIELGPGGMWLYNSANQYTAWFSTQLGYAQLTGDIVARSFRSQGYQTAGYGYIEIGDTGANDPVDEVRMWVGGSVASMRNPSDLPGVIRFSMTRPSTGTLEMYGDRITTPNAWFLSPRQTPGTQLGVNSWSITLRSGYNNAGSFFVGKDANNYGWFHNTAGGGAIKLLDNNDTVQIRNQGDTQYGNLVTGNLNVVGTLSASSFNPSQVYSNTIYSYGTLGAAGRVTSGAGVLASGYLGYVPLTFSGAPANNSIDAAGTIVSRDQIVSNGNVTSINGSFYSRGAFVGSNPEIKSNIVEINVNATDLLKDVKLYAWNWRDQDGNPTTEPGMGMLTSELPYISTPEAGKGENGDRYDNQVILGLLIQRGHEQDARIAALEARLEALS
jgi:hypothetical protein